MSTYLVINLLIIFFPLLLSFDKKVAFYKNYKSVFTSTFTVGIIYIIWDSIAVLRGDWNFNREYVYGLTIFNLPFEEILFFITVSYSCIFIYEVLKNYLVNKELIINNIIFYLFILIFLVAAIIFNSQYYTFTVLLFSAGFLIISFVFYKRILKSKIFWLTILISYLPFFIVNYFLTSLPVVSYSSNAIWGIRITTIPVEDFFYSFSMISFWILTFETSKKLFRRNKI